MFHKNADHSPEERRNGAIVCVPPFPLRCPLRSYDAALMEVGAVLGSFCLSHGASSPLFPLVKNNNNNNNNLQIYFSGNLEKTLLGKKSTTLLTYSTHQLQCSPTPRRKKPFFLWCIYFSKVTSEAFPSWPLKQHQKKKSLPQEAHEAIAVAWNASLCTDATGEATGRGGGADIFPRLFLSPEEEDEDGVMSEVPFVRQRESLSSSFRYTLFFFSFHYRIWCHLFLPPPQEKKRK